MKKAYFKYNKKAEEDGLDLNITISFYSSDDKEKTMQLCSCTISNGYDSTDYAWVVGETTLEEVINDFLKRL